MENGCVQQALQILGELQHRIPASRLAVDPCDR
jgi:hypothetical protein